MKLLSEQVLTHNYSTFFKSLDASFIFLVLFLISLPILEALKNIFLVLFFLSWLISSRRDASLRVGWDSTDTIFLMLILGIFIVTSHAYFFLGEAIDGIRDFIKFVIVGWLVSRTRFNSKQIYILFISLIIGTVLGLLHTYYYLGCQSETCIELNSVGHVNHSAIFIVMVLSLCLSLMTIKFDKYDLGKKLLLLFLSFFFLKAILDGQSRAALLMALTIVLLWFAYISLRSKSKLSFILGFFAVTILLGTIIYNSSETIKKFSNGIDLCVSCDPSNSPRQRIRNFSYYLFLESPYFGHGFKNFANYNLDDIQEIVTTKEGYFDRSKFENSPHPHNIYYFYLTGGGIFMFTIFMLFWIRALWIVFKLIKLNKGNYLVFNSLNVIMTMLIIGMVNTTFEHENALLSIFIIALAMSEYRFIKLS